MSPSSSSLNLSSAVRVVEQGLEGLDPIRVTHASPTLFPSSSRWVVHPRKTRPEREET